MKFKSQIWYFLILIINLSYLSNAFCSDHDWRSLGIKFGMSKKEILVKDKGTVFNELNNIIEKKNAIFLNYICEVIYHCDAIVPYANDKLFKVIYEIKNEKNICVEYNDIQKSLEKKYGKPSDGRMLFWMDENNIDYNVLSHALGEGYIYISTSWNFKDFNVCHIAQSHYIISHDVEYSASWAVNDYFNHERFIVEHGGLRNAYMYGLNWGMDINKAEEVIKKAELEAYSPYTLKRLKNAITVKYYIIKNYDSFPMTIFFKDNSREGILFNGLPPFMTNPKSISNGLCGIKINYSYDKNDDAVDLLSFLNVNNTMDKLTKVACEKRSIAKSGKVLLKEPDDLYLNFTNGILKYDYVWKTGNFVFHNVLYKDDKGENIHELWLFPPK